MGQLINRPNWEKDLEAKHRHLLDGLERHLALQPYSLEHRGWFDDGRSGSPVARVMCSPHAAQLILKFCASPQRAEQMGLALRPLNAFVKRHLAKLEGDAFTLGGDACARFMQVAGGNLHTYQSMATLRKTDPARTDIDYRTIAKSVIGKWNENGATHVPSSVRSVVAGIVGRRRDRVIRWIRTDSDLGSREPLSFLTGQPGRWVIKGLLVGKAHGDLTGRNILIPTVPTVKAGGFQLVDYDHYTENAALARDPMHLLVALALDDFDLQPSARPDLIKAIVDPNQAGIPHTVDYFREISLAIHEGCSASFAKGLGLGGDWTQQCLLALVGVALLRVGRDLKTAQPEVARRWCYELASAAAERYRNQFGDMASSNGPPIATRGEIIDRFFEQEALTDRLAYGPHGVLSVQGKTGVGKSKLVDVVINALGTDDSNQQRPRYVRRYATPDYRLDVSTLIELISGEPSRVGSAPGAALVRLEAVLTESRAPVVVAVESAEQLLDPNTHRLVDLGLDEAFTLLNADEDHRVSVVLETSDGEALATAVSWPNEDTVTVPSLEPDEFFNLLRQMAPGSRLRLDRLSSDERLDLWERAEGVPRIGELVYATVSHAHVSLPTLLAGMRNHQDEPATYLIRTLIDGMHPLDRDVMRALAAFRTPVRVRAVQNLLDGTQQDQVEQSLLNLRDDHLLRCDEDLFFLPAADAKIVLEQMSEADRRRLFYAAAKVLKGCAERAPRNLADLRYHLAELRAVLCAKKFPLAQRVIAEIDEYLRAWNCSPLLLLQRIEVRGRHKNRELEQVNENALGGIYVALGDLKKANDAYGRALALAGPDAKPKVLARLHTNLAALNWASNNIEMAQVNHEYALSKATEAGDAIAAMGAMNGLADCHRRRGEFAKAIERATEAFETFRLPEFADLPEAAAEGRSLAVGLAARLSRWHAEQADVEQARGWLEEIRAIAENGDAGHRATYLDALADLLLFERLRTDSVDEVIEVIETAGRAVDLAFEVQDPVILLQARTTMCVAHLCAGRAAEAAKMITRAGWHRRPGRHLVVLGLTALTKRLTGDHRAAERLFEDLRKEANERIANDTGLGITAAGEPVETGRGDFGARHFQGFARCGLVVAGRADVTSAVESFRMPDIVRRPHAPGLVDRMAFMLERLDESATRPGILQPAIDALRHA